MLSEADNAFLTFCVHYNTDEREVYRERYERLDEREMEGTQTMAEGIETALVVDPDTDVRAEIQGLPGTAVPDSGAFKETQIHPDEGRLF